MKSANISQTRNNLSALLKLVKRGQKVPIRKRQRIIAYLVPPPVQPGLDPVQDDLVEQGIVRPPFSPLDKDFIATLSSTPRVQADVEAALLASREEDR